MKNSFTLRNATESEIYKFRKQLALRKYREDPTDYSSLSVRIAMLTEKIIHSIRMFRETKSRDTLRYTSIQALLERRERNLMELRRKDYNRYMYICKEYNIPVETDQLKRFSAYKHLEKHNVRGPIKESTKPLRRILE